MGLADRREHLAGRQQDLLLAEVAARQHVAHRVEVGLELLHAPFDEAVGDGEIEPEGFHPPVDPLELRRERVERCAVLAPSGELGVDARLACLLVLEEPVGDARVGGDDVDPAKDPVRLAQDDVLDDILEGRHRGAADLLDADHVQNP